VTSPLPVGVIGAGRHASALAGYEAPLRGARIARWSPSPDGRDRSGAAAHAERVGAGFAADWDALAGDPSIPAVLVVSDGADRTTAVEAALRGGKTVCCPVPAVTRSTELDRLSAVVSRGGTLISAGALRHTAAGKRALRIAAQGELGALQSMYAAARFPWAPPSQSMQSILDEAGWEMFDFLLSLTPAAVQRVHAYSGTLFGSSPDDTAVLIIRFADDVIGTLEVSRCLPPAIPVTPIGDVEVEVIGSRQAIRVAPGATAVQVFGASAALSPWVEDPVISMVEELAAVASGAAEPRGDLESLRRAVALMDAVRATITRT
jgi:predicted dehydrogenase